jgi:HEXXH motif-containing protein
MKLSAKQWFLSGGKTPEWNKVLATRTGDALAGLKSLAELLRKDQPSALKALKIPQEIAKFIAAPARVRDPLARFPALDCWLSLSQSFYSGGRSREEWEVHFPFFQGFAAALALAGGQNRKFPIRVGPGGSFHLTGARLYFDFGAQAAGAEAVVEVGRGGVTAKLEGGAVARCRELPEITSTMWVDYQDPLILQPIRVQEPDQPSAKEERRFAEVLSTAMENIARFDPELYAEMNDFLRIIVPLKNSANKGSVSSSYQNLRGAFCLSHSEDVLLQEETLIHEFCHQKMNLVAELDPMLEPGQGAQVFFSPLRPDARRLRGLLLGAHAFINVNRYLLTVRSREELSAKEDDAVLRNVARRMFHIEEMLRAVCGYTDLTEFGKDGTLLMWRELMRQYHVADNFPKGVMEEGRKVVQAQRDDHALGYTAMHRRPGLTPKQEAAAVRSQRKKK